MRIHALANAGMLIESAYHKVLIDALHRPLPPFPGPSPDTVRAILWALPPFDGLDALIISHEHGDHCDVELVREFCRRRHEVPVISTPRVIALVREGLVAPADLRTVDLELFDTVDQRVHGLEIAFARLEHAGRGYEQVSNLACVLRLEKTLVHTGDSEGHAANLEVLARLMPEGAVVCAPFPYLALQTTRERLVPLKPGLLYLMHLPLPEQDRFGWLKAMERALGKVTDLKAVTAGEPGAVHTV